MRDERYPTPHSQDAQAAQRDPAEGRADDPPADGSGDTNAGTTPASAQEPAEGRDD